MIKLRSDCLTRWRGWGGHTGAAPGNGQQKLDGIPVLVLTRVRGPQRASSLAGSGNQGPSALELPGEEGRALGIRVLGPLAAGGRAGSGGPEAARLPKTLEDETEEEPHCAQDGPLHRGARSEAETPRVTRRSAHHFPGLPDQSSTKWGRKWIPAQHWRPEVGDEGRNPAASFWMS